MKDNIPILSVLIILLFFTSCSTSEISVVTIRVRHKKQHTPDLSEKPLVAIADTGFILPLPVTKRDSIFTPALKENKDLLPPLTQKNELKMVKPGKINKAKPFTTITHKNNPHDEVKVDDKRKYHTMAVLSLIFGIVGLLFPPLSIAAIILGAKAIGHNETLATAGLILGIIGLALLILSILIVIIIISLINLNPGLFFLLLFFHA